MISLILIIFSFGMLIMAYIFWKGIRSFFKFQLVVDLIFFFVFVKLLLYYLMPTVLRIISDYQFLKLDKVDPIELVYVYGIEFISWILWILTLYFIFKLIGKGGEGGPPMKINIYMNYNRRMSITLLYILTFGFIAINISRMFNYSSFYLDIFQTLFYSSGLATGPFLLVTSLKFYNKKLFYLGVPKTGSTSIRKVLGEYNEHVVSTKLNSFKCKFTVVRNPIDRFISGYFEILARIIREDYAYRYYYIGLLDINDMESRFLKFIELCEHDLVDLHIKPQSYFHRTHDGKNIDFDECLLFDNLNYELDYFFKSQSIYFKKVPWELRKSKMAKDHLLEILLKDQVLLARVNDLFVDDWTLYLNTISNRIRNGALLSLGKDCDGRNSFFDYLLYHRDNQTKLGFFLKKIKRILSR